MIETALIDTGPLVALYHADDANHARCRDALDKLRPPLLTCLPVLTEAAWLLRKHAGGFRAIIEGFSSGLFALALIDGDDLPAIDAIMTRYADADIQFADACLAHLAEREGIRTVFTTDRRDFSIIRLKRNRSLRLIPEIR